MSQAMEIPLKGGTSQSFQVTLANITYAMAITWREPFGWFMDLGYPDGTKLISGLPLRAGEDLFAPYGYLGLGGFLLVLTDGNPTTDPTYANLGSESHLYFVTP